MLRYPPARNLVAAAVLAVASSGGAGAVGCGKDYGAAPDALPDGGSAEGAASDGAVESSDASSTACDVTIVDHDPLNCGKCGHSCLGGACAASACEAVVVGSSTGETVIDIAVDGQRILWLTSVAPWAGDGHVYACPRAGCAGAPPTSITGPTVLTGSLAGDGKTAFFSIAYPSSSPSGLRQILANSVAQPVAKPHNEAVRLQLVDGILYFATLYEPPSTGMYAGTMYQWDGVNESLVGHFDGADNFNELVIAGTHVFLASATLIATCTIGNCQTQAPFFVISASPAPAPHLATDGTSLMWTNESSVFSCSVGAAPCPMPNVLLGPAQLGAAVRTVAFEHGDLYVSTAKGDIFACRPADCAGSLHRIAHAESLFEGSEYRFGHTIAADDEAAYWSELDGSPPAADASSQGYRIMKIAK
ncbi:MAG: putative serine/threonine-protein kinase pknH [Myxococcaceae bacterium]|nr:putative serine/threonine-protein kinase pknH [Myxococcaceae bacterium]